MASSAFHIGSFVFHISQYLPAEALPPGFLAHRPSAPAQASCCDSSPVPSWAMVFSTKRAKAFICFQELWETPSAGWGDDFLVLIFSLASLVYSNNSLHLTVLYLPLL